MDTGGFSASAVNVQSGGTLRFDSTVAYLTITGTGFTNAGNVVVTNSGRVLWGGTGTVPWLVNTGTIDVNAPDFSLRLDLPLDNRTGGLVKVRKGTLDLQGTYTAGGVSMSGKGAGTLDLYDGTYVTSVEKYDESPGGHINIKPKDQATLDFTDHVHWTGDLMLRGDLSFDSQKDANDQMAILSQTGDAEVAGGTLNFNFIWDPASNSAGGWQNMWRNTGTYLVSGDSTVNMTFYGTAPPAGDAAANWEVYFRIADGGNTDNASVIFNMYNAPGWMNIGADGNGNYYIHK